MPKKEKVERLMLYLPPELKERLATAAVKDERTMNSEVIWIVKQYLDTHAKHEG